MRKFWRTGLAERDERGRGDGQAGPAHAAQPQLVHPGHLRHERRRPLRGPGLAGQPAQKSPLEKNTASFLCFSLKKCRSLTMLHFSILLQPTVIFIFENTNYSNV